MSGTAARWESGAEWAGDVQGQAMKGGHFFPEENPAGTAEVLKKFLAA